MNSNWRTSDALIARNSSPCSTSSPLADEASRYGLPRRIIRWRVAVVGGEFGVRWKSERVARIRSADVRADGTGEAIVIGCREAKIVVAIFVRPQFRVVFFRRES